MIHLLQKTFIFVLSLLLTLPALAKIRLVEWHTANTIAPLVLPVRDGETPEEASERYLKALSQNSELLELFAGRVPEMKTIKFQEIGNNDYDTRIMMIANRAPDYTQNSPRVANFKKYFDKMNQKSFILPVVANLGLTKQESTELNTEITEKFPMLVALGGDDVDPRFYKTQNAYSRNLNTVRDRFEINLIKDYVTSAKGFLLGVCRGSQLSSVALGYKMVQDIPAEVGMSVHHGDDWHDVKLTPTTNGILKSVLPAAESLLVNSYHHQAVIFKEGGPLEIAARSEDGITEATEFKNGRGLLLQFHPELMGNELGFEIVRKAVSAKNRSLPLRCSRTFSY
ncbi:MAG: gamma-glutamyl-gamma-aminobutyrate hydrolase family protein [Bdellovibrionales bacterium]|nr:gamma-glutamyl-gamma-aminobutyrate hydrolase family protein [Bdellovibrionales bacterium]